MRDRYLGTTELISVSSDGTKSNSDSGRPTVSADGRYVAFDSNATNLVPGDTRATDVFLRDRLAGTTELVTVDSNEVKGSGSSPSMSNDGRFVAFWSGEQLVNEDTNGRPDMYVRDRLSGTTSLASKSSDGTVGNTLTQPGRLSGNGRFVVWHTGSTNHSPLDDDSLWDVYLHDRQSGTTELISVNTAGEKGNDSSFHPCVSDDGRFVAFFSPATNLSPEDSDDLHDVFVRDRVNSTTTLISKSSLGVKGNDWSRSPSISADGQFVVYLSNSSNLSPEDGDSLSDVYVHDLSNSSTTLASVGVNRTKGDSVSDYTTISGDGLVVAFVSLAQNLIFNDTNGRFDVFTVRNPVVR
ncbi:MAG: hypothetical protein WC314_07405 [Vulcanimicrobiota bacterium]